MLQEIVVSSLAVLILIPGVWSHGFMWFPWTWNNENQIPLGKGLEGAKFGWYYPQPDVVCDPKSGAQCSGSSIRDILLTGFPISLLSQVLLLLKQLCPQKCMTTFT